MQYMMAGEMCMQYDKGCTVKKWKVLVAIMGMKGEWERNYGTVKA